ARGPTQRKGRGQRAPARPGPRPKPTRCPRPPPPALARPPRQPAAPSRSSRPAARQLNAPEAKSNIRRPPPRGAGRPAKAPKSAGARQRIFVSGSRPICLGCAKRTDGIVPALKGKVKRLLKEN